MGHEWDSRLAEIWTRNVAPSRPTVSELALYTDILRGIQENTRKRVRILTLGSTPEFRDWGYSEDLDVTVVDCNLDYLNAITHELRHKVTNELVVVARWEEMEFDEPFDMILGDLVFGNVERGKFEEFLQRIDRALKPGGYFLGKNVLFDEERELMTAEDRLEAYRSGHPYHPYSSLIYAFAMQVVNREERSLDFRDLFHLLESFHREGRLSDREMAYFTGVGLEDGLDFSFFVPSVHDVHKALSKTNLFVERQAHTSDVFTADYPIYIIRRSEIAKGEE